MSKATNKRDKAALKYMEKNHILAMEHVTPTHRAALYAILDGVLEVTDAKE